MFVKYEIPGFMDKVWFEEHEEYKNWYMALAQGTNIRKLNIPIPYTKKMSHFFMQAPNNMSVKEALRWGQVIEEWEEVRNWPEPSFTAV